MTLLCTPYRLSHLIPKVSEAVWSVKLCNCIRAPKVQEVNSKEGASSELVRCTPYPFVHLIHLCTEGASGVKLCNCIRAPLHLHMHRRCTTPHVSLPLHLHMHRRCTTPHVSLPLPLRSPPHVSLPLHRRGPQVYRASCIVYRALCKVAFGKRHWRSIQFEKSCMWRCKGGRSYMCFHRYANLLHTFAPLHPYRCAHLYTLGVSGVSGASGASHKISTPRTSHQPFRCTFLRCTPYHLVTHETS